MWVVVCAGAVVATSVSATSAARVSPAAVATAADTSPEPPNVVIVFVDDMGWGDLPSQHGGGVVARGEGAGAAVVPANAANAANAAGTASTPAPPLVGSPGDPGWAMPNLERLEREGTRFTNFYVSQPVCSASRASLMTGCYANRIGITGALGPSSRIGLHRGETTLGEIAKSQGYRTAFFGKWHLGHLPEFLPRQHGFDEYAGIPYSNDMWPLHPESPLAWPTLHWYEGDEAVRPINTMHEQSELTRLLTERTVAFIRESAEAGERFLVQLAHPQPHVPLAAGPEWRGVTEAGLYGDVMAELDWSVGAVLEALDEAGVADDTFVFFASDNGPWLSYGDHAGTTGGLREGKGTTWEGGVRVPCLVRWPGRVPAGQVSDVPWMTIDVLPTITRWLGVEMGDDGRPDPQAIAALGGEADRVIDGKDATDVLFGVEGAPSPNEAYFFYYHANDLEAVRMGRWKLHLPHRYRTMAGRPQGRGGTPGFYDNGARTGLALHDVVDDPRQHRDLVSEQPDVVKQIMILVEDVRSDLGDRQVGRAGEARRASGRSADAP